MPKCGRLASTENIFVTPFYIGLLVDQSCSMNRRRDDQTDINTAEIILDNLDNDNYEMNQQFCANSSSDADPNTEDHAADKITRIYICATMWHETREEMVTFLKSIFYLDEDQSARRMAQTYLEVCLFFFPFFYNKNE